MAYFHLHLIISTYICDSFSLTFVLLGYKLSFRILFPAKKKKMENHFS